MITQLINNIVFRQHKITYRQGLMIIEIYFVNSIPLRGLF